MQLTVKGQHLNVGDSLREHVRSHLTGTAGKYFRNPIEATVIFTKEKSRLYRAEISIHVGGGIVLQTHHEASDPYPAFDTAIARMATRLRRYKEKLRDHHRREAPQDIHMAAYTTFEAGEDQAEGGKEPAIIAEIEMPVMTLAVSDAVMHLELRELPALLFRNPSHGGYNLVYRRKDGNIGWVDPDGGREKKKKPAAPAPKKAAQKQAARRGVKKPPAKKAAKPAKTAKKTVKKTARKTPPRKKPAPKRKT